MSRVLVTHTFPCHTGKSGKSRLLHWIGAGVAKLAASALDTHGVAKPVAATPHPFFRLHRHRHKSHKHKAKQHKCGCEIPETECPPRCPCEIFWKASRGECLVCRLRVTNTSCDRRRIELEATPFESSCEPGGAQVDLEPREAELAPGESVTVTGRLTVGDELQPGELYHAEIRIRSDHEQCVRIKLWVEHDCVAHCDIEHGEAPVRLRAHHWYDHFQCAEPCSPVHPKHDGEPQP